MSKEKIKVENSTSKFTPMRLQTVTLEQSASDSRVTVTTTLKGSAADEFEILGKEFGLNRSQLLTQMVYHCLGKTNELRDFYRRLVILGE